MCACVRACLRVFMGAYRSTVGVNLLMSGCCGYALPCVRAQIHCRQLEKVHNHVCSVHSCVYCGATL